VLEPAGVKQLGVVDFRVLSIFRELIVSFGTTLADGARALLGQSAAHAADGRASLSGADLLQAPTLASVEVSDTLILRWEGADDSADDVLVEIPFDVGPDYPPPGLVPHAVALAGA
jgi:hypothetical protein